MCVSWNIFFSGILGLENAIHMVSKYMTRFFKKGYRAIPRIQIKKIIKSVLVKKNCAQAPDSFN